MSLKFSKLTLLPVFATIILISACSSGSDTKTDIQIGTEARLRGGPDVTIVAVDQESIQALAKAKAANDEYGIKQLILLGKVFSVPNGTKVLVIDAGWIGDVQVRILEGTYAGKAVWTDIAWVKKEKGTLTSQNQNIASSQSSNTTSSPLTSQQTLDQQLFDLISEVVATDSGEVENPDNIKRVAAVLDQGANVNTRSEFNDTPLIMAARNGHIKVMQMLLDKGADINAQDNKGMTAVMWAAQMGDTDMTQILVAKGANLNIKDSDGFTALSGIEGAIDKSHQNIRRILKRAGAK